ncbi:MAG: hypothetical protein J07HQW1_03463 [Haloquadratum walsbyi J07HQW1]|uniref:Uncharacterized protein n=1 Tax=Haloquadratum walsbyi J07HQW1 TaxID=1238424 RepID=U1PMF0_9EURY|nr:MAG: hypothetical protein J07HQW1_03463 [Haloquadratum walsbyi J07HQW1]
MNILVETGVSVSKMRLYYRISDILYAEQAQSHGLQAVDTRRHALQNPTVVARFKFQNTHI